MTDSFLPEPVVVKQPKFTRVEGSRHSYAITANHVEKLQRGFLRPNILLQYLVRTPPQLAAKCDGDPDLGALAEPVLCNGKGTLDERCWHPVRLPANISRADIFSRTENVHVDFWAHRVQGRQPAGQSRV